MAISKPRWRRERAGLYAAIIGLKRYEIERFDRHDVETDTVFWLCREEGVPFERAATLREAKLWCEISGPEPEGKPLIEIL